MIRMVVALLLLLPCGVGVAAFENVFSQTTCNIAWKKCAKAERSPAGIVMEVMARVATVAVSPQQEPSPASVAKAVNSAELLAKLSADPFNEATQTQVRTLIQSCATAKDTKEMYACTGFLVTPQVRLQCLTLNPCMPVEFSERNMNSPDAWQRWYMTYPEIGPDAAVAFARPWTASRDLVNRCGAKSTYSDGTLDQHLFSFCMVESMGGASTEKARLCYAKTSTQPLQFGPCLFDTKLTPDELKAADCLQSQPGMKDECLKGANRQTVPLVLACLELAKSDISIFGKCVKGTRIGANDANVALAQACVGTVIAGASIQSEYERIVKCAVKAGAGSDLLRSYEQNKELVACGSQNVGKPLEAANCLKAAGVKLPKEVAIASCLNAAKDDLKRLECTGAKLPREVEVAKRCNEQSAGDGAKMAVCVAGNFGLPPEQQRLLNCSQKGSLGAGAACIAAPYAGKEVGAALVCGVESGGSPAGTLICMAGPSMNAELRIAAECVGSTGGEPISFAGCAGGRLVVKELQQCISGNWKAENGCFGENNSIVQYYTALEKGARSILAAAGLEGAYNNMLNDIKTGKLGKNNEIVRIFNALNAVTQLKPEEAARRITDDAEREGKAIIVGVVKLAEEVGKVQEQVKKVIGPAAPLVPSVSADNGKVTVGVPVIPGTSVTVGDGKAEAKLPGIRIEVRCC
ncbi:hypothetical protein [Achromobacter xylosoxidans]|uniref:hypothetical protein n=1 Tax=Alcaligenes xylosoxydans xylosoxydans TaxID=85698 RepID=UPI001178C9CD|nr:hypothetical protein [Achromobacter xylosoxidans]